MSDELQDSPVGRPSRDDREEAEEMIEILITNYLKKKWKKERLRGLTD